MPAIVHIEGWALRCPIARPVETSFGVMRDRPAVFLRLTDAEGATGLGEVFANWPAAGAEHRVNLLIDDIAPLLRGETADDPAVLWARLNAATRIRALQCGEFGPFDQVIAAIDTALWDLNARRHGVPLAQLLTDGPVAAVPAYASGIHIDAAEKSIETCRTLGFDAFKLKVGFARVPEADRAADLARGLRPGERLFADANQAWAPAEAVEFMRGIEGAGIGWLEEPIPATCTPEAWAEVAGAGRTPLAAGENIAGFSSYESAIASGHIHYVQPDLAKWGGITGCLEVARAALRAGRVYCPHFLGGGVGLAASAHLLAAVGGAGLLEVDTNPNPLRESFGEGIGRLENGYWVLSPSPGLGVAELPSELGRYVTHHRQATL